MIGVVGSTGFTGKLVAAELRRRAASFFIAGRNANLLKSLSESLGGVETRLLDVRDQKTFSALDGVSVILNCAGPYTDLGEPVVQEAIARRAHYLDLTGEQGFIKLVYDKYDQLAKDAGVALVPACAFEYAIGDAAAAIACAGLTDCELVEIVYHVTGMYTSAGTRKSIIRAFTAPGFRFSGGRLIESEFGGLIKKVRIEGKEFSALSFPAGEPLMLPKHTKVREVNAFMTADLPVAFLKLAAASQPVLKLFADFLVHNAVTDHTPSEIQRKTTAVTMKITAKNSAEERQITLSGKDPYGVTAVIAVDAAMHLQSKGPSVAGAISPSMINSAEAIREVLITNGFSWS